MRNLFQSTLKDIGIITIRGQDYHMQILTYGTRQHTYIFRKGELHRHGLVFTSRAQYLAWRNKLSENQQKLF